MTEPTFDPEHARTYTFTEAAAATGVSRSTIRRRHAEGAFPNAELVDGAFRISRDDLEAAGFILDFDENDIAHDLAHDLAQAASTELEAAYARIADAEDAFKAERERAVVLDRDLAVERVRREAAEQRVRDAEQRVADVERHLNDWRGSVQAVLMLTTGPETAAAPSDVETAPRRRLFGRRQS